MTVEQLRARWVSASGRDMRSNGNRQAYHRAYDAYYHALGRSLGYAKNHAGYYVAPDGTLPGCNDMEDQLQGR